MRVCKGLMCILRKDNGLLPHFVRLLVKHLHLLSFLISWLGEKKKFQQDEETLSWIKRYKNLNLHISGNFLKPVKTFVSTYWMLLKTHLYKCLNNVNNH